MEWIKLKLAAITFSLGPGNAQIELKLSSERERERERERETPIIKPPTINNFNFVHIYVLIVGIVASLENCFVIKFS